MSNYILLTRAEDGKKTRLNLDQGIDYHTVRRDGQNDAITRILFLGGGVAEVTETVEQIDACLSDGIFVPSEVTKTVDENF